MAVTLGKRKRRIGATISHKLEKAQETAPESDTESDDARDAFRRAFEAKFKPLAGKPKRPEVEVDLLGDGDNGEDGNGPEDLRDDESEESDWNGVSDDDDDSSEPTAVEVIQHTSTTRPESNLTKQEKRAYMVRCNFSADSPHDCRNTADTGLTTATVLQTTLHLSSPIVHLLSLIHI